MKKEQVLLIEDDADIREGVRILLESENYCVEEAENGKSGLELLSDETDLVILDIMMPGMSGLRTCEEIRKVSNVPVLFLTAKGEIDDKSKGFEAGADDYMVKPFIAQEFVWRITAILRRTYKESEESSFLLDACKVDLEQAEVYREGQEPVSLTAKEVEILKKLYANAGRIVTLGALCQTVCGDIYIGYEKTLMSHIRHIREKIEEKPSSPVSLVTVKGIGYKLILKDKSR